VFSLVQLLGQALMPTLKSTVVIRTSISAQQQMSTLDMREEAVLAFYLQGGPAIVAPNGEDAEVELSGKVGASVQASDSFSVYGELSFITAEDDPVIGTKLGAKYSF
jgi:hypothetical protein